MKRAVAPAGSAEPPAVAGPSATGTAPNRDLDWDWRWEGLRAGGKLYLFCYVRDTVVAVPPLDFE